MTLSYEYFDKLVARHCDVVWHRISKLYPEARSPLKKMELGTYLIQMYYTAIDKFGTQAIDGFRFAYDMRMPFEEVLNEIVIGFQKQAHEISRPKIYTSKVVPRTIGGVPIPLTVAHTEHFEDGKLVSKQYREENGGIRVDYVEVNYIGKYYQEKALGKPNTRTVFKFLVSNFCSDLIMARLEKEMQSTVTVAPVEDAPKKNNAYQQMTWNGTQRQLAELFIELQRKGWIEEVERGAIEAAFVSTGELAKLLLPYAEEGIPQYKKLFTVRYKRMFDRLTRYPKAKRL